MPARNTPDSFGWISRAIHWIMAVLIIAMLALGTYIADMQPSLANLWLFGLHKSIGVSLLVLVILRLGWHRLSPPPASLKSDVPHWQTRASGIVHGLIYALLIVVPLTGWIASSATGIDSVLFNRFTLPAIAPVSEAWEKTFFAAHGLATNLLIACIAIHTVGALQHHYIHRDATLRRMLRG